MLVAKNWVEVRCVKPMLRSATDNAIHNHKGSQSLRIFRTLVSRSAQFLRLNPFQDTIRRP